VLSGFVQHLGGVAAQLLLDDLKRRCLAHLLILHGRADHPTGVGDEIRNIEHTPLMQDPLRTIGEGDIGALHHQPGVQPLHIVLVNHIGTGSRYPYIAGDINHPVTLQLLGVGVVDYTPPFRFQPDQLLQIQPVRIVNAAPRVGYAHQNGTLGRQAVCLPTAPNPWTTKLAPSSSNSQCYSATSTT